MKFATYFVLCSSIFAVSLSVDLLRTTFRMFNDPNISNTEMKAHFVDYVNGLSGISKDELRTKTPRQLAEMAIQGLLERYQKQPEHDHLIREHLQYFMDYKNSPVPHSPYIDFDKDLSKLSDAELKVYLVGYLHAMTDTSEVELSHKTSQELINLVIHNLAQRFQDNKSPEQAEIIRKHYEYFQQLQRLLQRQ